MRLLIALPDGEMVRAVQSEMEWEGWQITAAADGEAALSALMEDAFDILLLHLCLPRLDGCSVGNALARAQIICPPRILFIRPPECCSRPVWADCVVNAGLSAERLCTLLKLLGQKPLSMLAAAQRDAAAPIAAQFLDDIGLSPRFKGHAYAAWLLEGMMLSPVWESLPLGQLYRACAQHFGVTAASVERCVRVAVESVFTQGSMQGIERFFGATIDPERGKPTNRAFLLQAAQQLRLLLHHSRTAARSPNSSEMHHNPAAPTSV